MKNITLRICTLFTALLLFSFSADAQWAKQTSGTTHNLKDVFFLTTDVGVAVGSGTILRTSNSGGTWNLVFTGNYYLEAVTFVNNSKGFAVGYNYTTNKSAILSTADAGSTWSATTLTDSATLLDIQFVDSQTGFITGSNGVILKTVNGGDTWTPLTSGVSDVLTAVSFTDKNKGIIVGGSSTLTRIISTSDGGSTWNTITAPATTYLQSVNFPSQMRGYAAGLNGEVFKTIDGGSNWTKLNPVGLYDNTDLYFINDSVGYIVGGMDTADIIFKTFNGGQTWVPQSPNIGTTLNAVAFITPNLGFIVGNNGTILKTVNGGSIGVNESAIPSQTLYTFPNPVVSTVSFSLTGFTGEINKINIYDMKGILVTSFTGYHNGSLDLSSLEHGAYLLQVETGNSILRNKIIKL
jgi:photosystem II stability/assembly factor-like uncharacterized protein